VTSLSPTSARGGGRSLLPLIIAALVALVIGVAAGWWWAGRDTGGSAGSTASPSPSDCPTELVSAYPAPATITVNVYNATTRAGLAKGVAAEMQVRGFVIGAVSNDPKKQPIAAPAEVRHGPGGEPAAAVVAAQVSGAVVVADTRTDGTVDLALGDGYTALVAPDVAAATLAPKPPPGCPTPSPAAPAATPAPTA
jgi:hypothetical protein